MIRIASQRWVFFALLFVARQAAAVFAPTGQALGAIEQLGECKPGYPCQAARYEANTPYNYLTDGGFPRTPLICTADGGFDGGSRLLDGGCGAVADGGQVIYPEPALKVRTKESVLYAVGVPFNRLPPCPGIAVSTMQFCTDCTGGDGGLGAYVACSTAGWGNPGGGGGGGISPCTVDANGNLSCPGDGGFARGIRINETTATSVFPGVQGLVYTYPAGDGFSISQSSTFLDIGIVGGVISGAQFMSFDNATGNVRLRDVGFGGTFSEEMEQQNALSLRVAGDAGVLKNLSVAGTSQFGDVMTVNLSGTNMPMSLMHSGATNIVCLATDAGVCYARLSWSESQQRYLFTGGATNGHLTDVASEHWFSTHNAGTQDGGAALQQLDAFPVLAQPGAGAFSALPAGVQVSAVQYQTSKYDGGWVTTVDGTNWQSFATDVNGAAGGEMSGYHNATDFSGHGVHVVNGNRLTANPIPSGLPGRVGFSVTKVGTVGGTFDVSLFDTTAGAAICSRTGISCTASLGVTSANCTTTLATLGDDLELRVDTTNCTGTEPSGTLEVRW